MKINYLHIRERYILHREDRLLHRDRLEDRLLHREENTVVKKIIFKYKYF